MSDTFNTMGLKSLLNEPQRLKSEADRVNLELESLVMDNYKIFVENLTCSATLQSEEKKLEGISQNLEKSLKELRQRCLAFKDQVNQYVTFHKRNRKTLHHHMQLLELLEVPQLVDACARNSFHDEAIELANFVNGLERRHLLASEVRSLNGKIRGGSGVIQNIVNDVHKTLTGLRQQLLIQLTESTSLPREIHLLSTLRKLDGLLIDRHISLERHENEELTNMSDTEREIIRTHLIYNSETRLQMDFLEARSIFIHSQRSAEKLISKRIGDDTQPSSATENNGLGIYGKVIEMIESYRTLWYSVITQYVALFEENSLKTSKPNEKGSFTSNQRTVLNAWATTRVVIFLSELRHLLSLITEGASLRSIIEQCFHFASRMGQVGCDFSSLLLPLFKDVIIERWYRESNTAFEHFKVMLKTERVRIDNQEDKEQIIPLFFLQEVNTKTGDHESTFTGMTTSESDSAELPPPLLLMRYPPLAYLLNSLLSSLNFTRECPLEILKEEIMGCISSVLTAICQHIIEKSEDIRNLGSKYFADIGEKEDVRHPQGLNNSNHHLDLLYAQAIAQEFLPHLLVCVECIFGASPVTTAKKIQVLAKTSKQRNNSGGHDAQHNLYYLINDSRECKEILSSTSYSILEGCWNRFIDQKLLLDGTALIHQTIES